MLCTFNRVQHLQLALESLKSQTLSSDDFEIIVVDNASTDSTSTLVSQLQESINNLRYVFEQRIGLSHARNRGTVESHGSIVVFVDDDAVAEPGCLRAHLDAFESDPSILASAGRIFLRWPNGRPKWVPSSQESYYSGLDLGETQHTMAFPSYPYGANMAIRRDVLIDIGGFSTELGRRGNNLISGEEKDLFLRISNLEGSVVYVPGAVVHHHVLEERSEPKWLLRRSLAQGRSQIVMDVITHGRQPVIRSFARTALHLARSFRIFIKLIGALLLRREASYLMEYASMMLRWLGAALEGMRLTIRPNSYSSNVHPARES